MSSISNIYEFFIFLKEKNLLQYAPAYWWPNYGTFEILVGAVLTQNTKWENVEKSLENLRQYDVLSIEKIANINLFSLVQLIAPSGFKNQKAKRLKIICQNIIEAFQDFEVFQNSVSRQWLLEQKGIGFESADAILCYCCKRDEFVVDAYTNRLLKKFHFDFDNYDNVKSWFEFGINENLDKIKKMYNFNITINQIYCRLHGKIVEFMKNKSI